MQFTMRYECPICASSKVHIERIITPRGTPYWECYCNTCSAEFDVLYSTPDGYEVEFLHFEDDNTAAERMLGLARAAFTRSA